LGVLDKREPFNPTVSMCNMSSMWKFEAISCSHCATELSFGRFCYAAHSPRTRGCEGPTKMARQ
jgi:hypothetical protein